ncbi:speckle-type POZ protein-like isoform X2 [Chrysoperla carnea]|uniref:speckle-type POZ protein-like isoform X2 n=1 Tax=Chrysoperla carnea TaxID=189513 RepID=UPI001D0641D8|nr:speckle-type POZ protein-like isoform X2 [Chrysoperla carnea]
MDQKGITNIEFDKRIYLWTINNFSIGFKTILKIGLPLTSPTFTVGKNNSVWCLKLHRKFNIFDSQNYLTLYLKLVSSDEEKPALASYKFSIINEKSEKVHEFEGVERFAQGKKISYNITREDRVLPKTFQLLSEDKLTIFCEIIVLHDYITDHSSSIQVPESRLLDDFSMLFESKKFCDFTLTVDGGKEFQVHKNILAARSPVFAAMFEHEMEECKQNRKAENLETMAGKILAAADKYDLKRLKKLCEKELCTSLTIENAAETLILADIHNADQLKAEAIYFINNNNSAVKSTTGWKEMIQTYPHIVLTYTDHLDYSQM